MHDLLSLSRMVKVYFPFKHLMMLLLFLKPLLLVNLLLLMPLILVLPMRRAFSIKTFIKASGRFFITLFLPSGAAVVFLKLGGFVFCIGVGTFLRVFTEEFAFSRVFGTRGSSLRFLGLFVQMFVFLDVLQGFDSFVSSFLRQYFVFGGLGFGMTGFGYALHS